MKKKNKMIELIYFMQAELNLLSKWHFETGPLAKHVGYSAPPHAVYLVLHM